MPIRLLTFILLAVCGCSTPSDPAPKPDAADRVNAPREGSDWPKFLGPNGDSSSPETGILTKWPKDGLKKLWDCPLGTGYAPPSIVGGRLFHFDRVENNARLSCRNAETGELVWKFEYPTDYEDLYGYDPGPRACPVVDGDRVYVYGVEGMLHCVSVADGKEVWKFDTKAQYRFHQNFFGVGSVPLVDGDLLIVAVGGSPRGQRPVDLRQAVGNGSGIVAFDKRTGAVKYAVSDELASYSSPILAKFGEQKIGLYFGRNGLLGFDPQAGKEVFQFKWRAKTLESVNAANPVVIGDKILLSECYEKGSVLLKLTSGKVEVVWSDANKDRGEQALLSHWCTPIHDAGFLYGCSGRNANDADLRCIELATGNVNWIERRTTRCTLLKVDGHILCLGEQGELRLLKPNPAKYEEVAKWEVPGLSYPSWAPPVLSHGLLYLRGKDENSRDGHRLICFELIPKK